MQGAEDLQTREEAQSSEGPLEARKAQELENARKEAEAPRRGESGS
jgi:hypothetical protein